MTVPSQIHTNISITNNMQVYNSSEVNFISNERHIYHNQSITSSSNTNIIDLESFDEVNTYYDNSYKIPSVSNLVEINNDEFKNSNNKANIVPPPSDMKNNNSYSNISRSSLNQVESNADFKFDDDFGLLPVKNVEDKNESNKPPLRPPPLPPLPPLPSFLSISSTITQNTENQKFSKIRLI